MKRTTSQTILAGLLAGSLVVPALAQSSASGIEFQSPRHKIAAGTTVKVKLLQDLSSSSAQSGDPVRVQVAGDDTSGIPAGAIFNGHVATAKPATPKRPASSASGSAGVAGPMPTTLPRPTPPRRS